MENKIVVILLIFLVFLLYVKSTSKYVVTDTNADWHSQYQTIGMDIDNTYPTVSKILALGSDVDLKQDQVNFKVWTAAASIQAGLNNGGGAGGIWGFRKQLLKEGHGTLEYLLVDPTSYMNRKAVAIDTILYPDPGGTTYVIPDYIIVRTSTISPTLTCDANATPSGTLDINNQPTSCTCTAGYYGNGSVCAICPQNAYCTAGVSTYTPCPSAGITGVQGAQTVNACYAACAPAPGGSTVSVGTTTGPGTCDCSGGYYGTGATCAQCLAGTYSLNGETGPSVTGCPACPAGSSTSPGGNTSPGSLGATACPACAVGYYTTTTGKSSCSSCTNGSGTGQAGTGAQSCTICAAGKYGAAATPTGVCASCISNRYTAGTGSTNISACTNCPAGTATTIPGLLAACITCPSNQSSLAGQNCLSFASAAALTQYQTTNSPCQGVWQLTTAAGTCPSSSTCPYAAGSVPGAVYTWSTSVPKAGSGTCPGADAVTSTAASPSCPANNCNATGTYNITTAAGSCPSPVACNTPSSLTTAAVYTWSQTTAATGTGSTPPSTSAAASPSCAAAPSCPSCGPGTTLAPLTASCPACGTATVGTSYYTTPNSCAISPVNKCPRPGFSSGSSLSDPGKCYTQLAAGGSVTTALKPNGDVFSWGYGAGVTGTLGGSVYSTATKTCTLMGVNAVASGSTHTVVLKDGLVYAWGDNAYGQLGSGASISTAVTGLSGVVTIGCGQYHTIAIKDGLVYCWGRNGVNTSNQTLLAGSSPTVAVAGLTGVVAVAGGNAHTVALKADGTVYSWGWNQQGAVTGTPAASSAAYPVTVATKVNCPAGVTAIAANQNYTVVIAGGLIYCWGQMGSRALPIGTGTTSSIGSLTVALSGSYTNGLVAVAAGADHLVALKSDGTVYSWGDNSQGQSPTNSQAQVSITGVLSIAAGDYHTVALKAGPVDPTAGVSIVSLIYGWGSATGLAGATISTAMSGAFMLI